MRRQATALQGVKASPVSGSQVSAPEASSPAPPGTRVPPPSLALTAGVVGEAFEWPAVSSVPEREANSGRGRRAPYGGERDTRMSSRRVTEGGEAGEGGEVAGVANQCHGSHASQCRKPTIGGGVWPAGAAPCAGGVE